MRDGAIRRTVKCVSRWAFQTDLLWQRAWARLRWNEPRYELRGTCNQCGACCETPMITVHGVVFHLKSLRALFVWWQRVVNGFELVEAQRRGHTFVFRCTHFDPETKLCDCYASRPGMCRDHPRVLLFEARPALLDCCGYKAVYRDSEDLRESLSDLDIPPEKMAEIERVFCLEPGEAAEARDGDGFGGRAHSTTTGQPADG